VGYDRPSKLITVRIRVVRCGESVQALLEGNRYFIKQVDAVRLQPPANDSVVPEMRYRQQHVTRQTF